MLPALVLARPNVVAPLYVWLPDVVSALPLMLSAVAESLVSEAGGVAPPTAPPNVKTPTATDAQCVGPIHRRVQRQRVSRAHADRRLLAIVTGPATDAVPTPTSAPVAASRYATTAAATTAAATTAAATATAAATTAAATTAAATTAATARCRCHHCRYCRCRYCPRRHRCRCRWSAGRRGR